MNLLSSIRYGSGFFNFRSLFIKVCAWLQRRPLLILDHNPEACSKVLACSEIKGTFLEHIFAIPAWQPLYSIESEDGEKWQKMAASCSGILRNLPWKTQIPYLTKKYITELQGVIDGETISRITLKIMYELLFEESISADNETLFYQASLEWRKEIAIKGKGNTTIKQQFTDELMKILQRSKYHEGFIDHSEDPIIWLSILAQPFIISPQINVSDIMASVFHFLRAHPDIYTQAKNAAANNDDAVITAIILESMRLAHPFPILERQLTRDLEIEGKKYLTGTQVLIPLDQFKHTRSFNLKPWLEKGSNAYQKIIFGAGRRMCLGKILAELLMTQMLKSILLHAADEDIQPNINHLYSGRNNDKNNSFRESCYQVRQFSKALWKSFKLGIRLK
jgi:hypothetical protein